MATLQPMSNPGSRLEAGNHILERAKSISTKLIKTRLDAFKKSVSQYQAAETLVGKATQAAQAANAKVAELDAIQDEKVFALAAAMAGDGAPRINPFKPLGFAAPTEIARMAYDKEVTAVIKLASAATRAKSAGKATKAAAAALIKAAKAVEAALPAMNKAKAAQATVIAKRDAIGIDFDRALAKLKRAARVAEDDGAEGLFDALFYVESTRPKKKTGKTQPPAPAPVTASNGAQPSVAASVTTTQGP